MVICMTPAATVSLSTSLIGPLLMVLPESHAPSRRVKRGRLRLSSPQTVLDIGPGGFSLTGRRLRCLVGESGVRRIWRRRSMTKVQLERHGRIGLVTIDNPPVNALSAAVRQGLAAAIEQANADKAVAAIVIASTG